MLNIVNIPAVTSNSFPVTLQVDGASLTLNLYLRFNRIAGYWVMDVLSEQQVELLVSIPLLTGDYPAANILMPYGYLKIGSAYVIKIASTADDWPGALDFANGNHQLWWGDTAS
jgi:hypothetical protein